MFIVLVISSPHLLRRTPRMLSTQSYAVKFFQLKQTQEAHATFVRLKEFIEQLFPVL